MERFYERALAMVPAMGGGVDLRLDPEREERELHEYLGSDYDHDRLRRHEHQVRDEFAEIADEARFYRTSRAYLYDLTAFAMSGTKLPYLREIEVRVPPPARLLDYGCGIGSDGLALLEAGYDVEFADFDNPSTKYLRWRLERRGLSAPLHDLDAGVPTGYDLAYAFDVIEHVPDSTAMLGELERRARLVAVNLLEAADDEPEMHHDLPLGELLAHTAGHRVVSYGLHHGRSHLVIYGPERVSMVQRALNRTRMATAAWRAKRRQQDPTR
jgi:2-polyprenyl-3-methyl-5-hydroxy-6-metoxy-1,4-benzoquinol methylase